LKNTKSNMKEVAKMLSDLKGCLAKRFKVEIVVIRWDLTGFARFYCNNYALIGIIFEDTKFEFQFDFNEYTNYISFYKAVLKTINNE